MAKRTNTAQWVAAQNRWRINVQKDGIRKSFYSAIPGRAGQREANAKADAWLDHDIVTRRIRLSDLHSEFMTDVKTRTSAGNWRPMESRWRNWIEPTLGKLYPDTLDDIVLQRVIDVAYKRGGLSRKMLGNIRSDMVAFIKFLRKKKLTTFRPEEITIPKGALKEKRRILQPEDIVKLFSCDQTVFRRKVVRDEFINAYRLAVLTGLRPGELRGLMRNDIVGDRLMVRRSINVDNEITAGKNDNAIRAFVLAPAALSCIRDQLQQSDGIYLWNITSDDCYRRRWRAYCEHNDIPYISPYEMRHTFVSVVQSLPEGWVKSLVGHSKSMDTFGVYAHATDGIEQKIAGGVEALFEDILNGAKEKSVVKSVVSK